MPKIIRCPKCFYSKSWVIRRNHRKCKSCRAEWSPVAKTGFGKFRISHERWKKIISVFLRERTILSVQRASEMSYVTAQKVTKFLREIMKKDQPTELSGICEVDETYFGGLWRNLPRWKRRMIKGTFGRKTKKQAFLGIVSRDSSQAIVVPIQKAQQPILMENINKFIKKGSTVFTDGLWAYRHLPKHGYPHDFVDHAKNEYVRGNVHTQTIEGLWGGLKARLKTVGGISKTNLGLFVGEQVWRYNFRHLSHDEKINRILSLIMKFGGRS